MYLLSIMLTLMLILIGVASLTLLERNVLSYIQVCKGPNKVGSMGVLQPISDEIKLFFKEHNILTMSNYIIYMITPTIGLMNSLLVWSIFQFLLIVFHLILVCYFFLYKSSGM